MRVGQRGLRWIGGFAVAGLLVFGPRLAWGATPSGEAQVVVDAGEIGTFDPLSIEDISGQATLTAGEMGIGPDELAVAIVWLDRERIEYGVRVRIEKDGVDLLDGKGDARGPIVARCTGCTEAELRTLAIEGVIEAIRRYRRLSEEAVAKPAPKKEPRPKKIQAPQPAKDLGRPPLNTMGWGGVVAMSVGATTLASGAVLAAQGELFGADGASFDYRPPGYAMIGVGSAVLLAGTALVVVDRVRENRRRRVSVAPGAGPSFAGATVRVSF